MDYPRNIMPLYSAKLDLIEQYAELNGNYLDILDSNLDTEYQIPLDQIKHIINFSDPTMPTGYFINEY